MKAALAFFSVVVAVGLLGLLTADTSFGRTLSSPPITGPWSGGGHHDAGYGGYAVWDGINGGKPLDLRTWTRPQVDKKFLENMQKLCAAGIPATAKIALAKCNGTGGPASYGAKKLFDLVAKIGWRFFDADLTKPGLQKSGHRPNFD